MAAICCQIFKIVVICIALVTLATGYYKFYQLLVDLKDAFASVGDVKSIRDVAWIPYIIVHVSSTVLTITLIYCLCRELCEDNYMYKYCFKCVFTLIVLIYILSVFPKSVLNIVYHKYDVSIQEWWGKILDVFESLLGDLTALGFQIILFMPTIKGLCWSAGACRKRRVAPYGHLADKRHIQTMPEVGNNSSCCLARCCLFKATSSGEISEYEAHSDDRAEFVNEDKKRNGCFACCSGSKAGDNGKSRIQKEQGIYDAKSGTKTISKRAKTRDAVKSIGRKTKKTLNTINEVHKKGKGVYSNIAEKRNRLTQDMKAKAERKLQPLHKRVDAMKETSTKVTTKIKERSMGDVKEGKTNLSGGGEITLVCKKCGTTSVVATQEQRSDTLRLEDMDSYAYTDIHCDTKRVTGVDSNASQKLELCQQCGEFLTPQEDNSQNNGSNSKCSACCTATKRRICDIYNNRSLCFAITLALANLHLLVYFVELVFIFCVDC